MNPIDWYLAAGAAVSLFTLALTLRNLRLFAPPPLESREPESTLVSVCIPCRNEEANIEAVVGSALHSTHTAIEVLVYDDDSSDRTGEILAELCALDPRVRAVTTRPLPAGWVGKQHACHQLSLAARGDWLLFIDADTRLEPGAVGRALAFARDSGSALVSTFPRQITRSPSEALVVPMMFYLLLGYLPFRRMRTTLSPAASAACGQFILAERQAYTSSGGHAAIRNSMHDGVKLPRLFRAAGHRTDLFDGTSLAQVRMYKGFSETWSGFAKNAYEGLGSLGLLAFMTVLHGAVHVAPWIALPIAATTGQHPAAALAGSAVMLQIIQRLALARRFRHPLVIAPLHPISVVLLTLIQWHSFLLHRRSARSWKGRTLGTPEEELVVLVDESDREIGTMPKQAAHLEGGRLHRAFSVFVFDDRGRLMLQQRAAHKYHFGSLWTNTCCSHPRPGEHPAEGAGRRLVEEMGIDIPLTPRGTFLYKASDPETGLTEHELDHVFVGQFSGEPTLNPDEASDWRWIDLAELTDSLRSEPERYTPWFPIALRQIVGSEPGISPVSPLGTAR